MSMSTWMTILKTKMAEVTGITQAHDFSDLPAAIGVFPTMIILPIEGRFEYSAGGPFKGYHEVQMTLYVASQVVPEAMSRAVPFITSVRNKLAGNMSLDGTVEHCRPSKSAPFYDGPGGIRYANQQLAGIVFRIEVKEDEAGSYSVSA